MTRLATRRQWLRRPSASPFRPFPPSLLALAAASCLLALCPRSAAQSDGQSAAEEHFVRVVPPSPEAAKLGEYGEVPLNYSTGMPSLTVPLYTVRSRDLSLPMSLSYGYSGLKTAAKATEAGLGWSLDAGGIVTREMRGNPDESANGYLAWAECVEEAANGVRTRTYGQTLLDHYDDDVCDNGNMFRFYDRAASGDWDSHPDVFSFSVPGYSGQIVFGPDGPGGVSPFTIPFQGLGVSYERDGSAGPIVGWTLVTPEGTRYEFGYSPAAIEETRPQGEGSGAPYSSAWRLTRVVSPRHPAATVTLSYQSLDSRPAHLGEVYQSSSAIPSDDCQSSPEPCCDSGSDFLAYQVAGGAALKQPVASVSTSYLNSVCFKGGRVDLNWAARDDLFTGEAGLRFVSLSVRRSPSYQPGCSANDLEAPFHEVQATHEYFGAPADADKPDRRRLMLREVEYSSRGGSYRFEYYGEGAAFPSRRSDWNAQDHFGYYNGQTGQTTLLPSDSRYGDDYDLPSSHDADRSPDFASALLGALKTVEYPTGGTATLEYEPNEVSAPRAEAAEMRETVTVSAEGGVIPGSAPARDSAPPSDGPVCSACVEDACGDFPDERALRNVVWAEAYPSDPDTLCDWDFSVKRFHVPVGGTRRVKVEYSMTTPSGTHADVLARVAILTELGAWGLAGNFCDGSGTDHGFACCNPAHAEVAFYANAPSGEGSRTGECDVELRLDAGWYYAIAITNADGFKARLSVTLPPEPSPVETAVSNEVEVSGLRVKRAGVSDGDGDATDDAVTRFEYDRPYSVEYFDGTVTVTGSVTASSGRLAYHAAYERRDCGYLLRTSAPSAQAHGHHVAYGRVTTVKEGEGGRVERDYRLPPGSSGTVVVERTALECPYNYQTGKRGGQPLGERAYDASGALVWETSTEYAEEAWGAAFYRQARGVQAGLERSAFSVGSGPNGSVPAPWVQDMLGHPYSGKLYGGRTYAHSTGRFLPALVRETAFDSDGGGSVTTYERMEYGSEQHSLPTLTVKGDSEGGEVKTYYDYVSRPAAPGSAARAFLLRGKTVKSRAAGASSEATVGGVRIEYAPGRLLPEEILEVLPSESGAEATRRLAKYEYDALGNAVVEYRGPEPSDGSEGATPTAYLWGYNGGLPVAEAKGARPEACFHTSFEAEEGGSKAPAGAPAFTGRFHYAPPTPADYVRTVEGLPAGRYVLEWRRYEQASGEWARRGLAFDHAGGDYEIRLPSGRLDEVRLFPEGALVTTFTHEPLFGLSTVCDPNGAVSRYEYDPSGRLLAVRDQDGNLLTTYRYQYHDLTGN